MYVTSPERDLRELRTDFWNNKGRQALFKAMNVQPNIRKAKNMILFIGDGESEHQASCAWCYNFLVRSISSHDRKPERGLKLCSL